ncbi:hypothetical protein N180_12370 [Pedobacter antarcticus 4BY]|uniref:Uncharacterized protein n=2 Tax=Pedobacter antarcticus TaxID=34086 RepID=A0A081PD17_9SPHI|nr:YqgE/AlgH family protein [Pedobacter antarcticus]KEQ28590.1 hypothetical protein N180_12370 [Pedobacter antarcticus 4BY]SFE36474.1 putative transcriptional regulator [Pedobacter antarcticus]
MINHSEPEAGKLLISEPFLNDPHFTRSVILLVDTTPEGTLGMIINQPTALLVSDLLHDLVGADFPVYSGGPVNTELIHFIHRCPEKISEGQELAKGIFWGGNYEDFKRCMLEHTLSRDEIRVFIGYAGWDPGQLQNELSTNTWIVSDQYDADMVFNVDEAQLWRDVVVNMGPRYAHISQFPKNPNLN